MTDRTTTPAKARKPRRMAREPKNNAVDAAEPHSAVAAIASAAPEKRQTKTGVLIDLLGREEGATLDQMVEATGWLPHTTRAALTGLRKKGHAVASEKMGCTRMYRIAKGAS
ncbi:DUF3489 domain-containing protein [Tsuneonella mangrovi]|uniref:DUF3489 domain-containing protein n=1 Tax=Tsuneonella mangrovi TaxID=1982042 RepID=UPI000BA25F34|nr:DUF3489 domain-containing protein [Tsuneonella mangrovi]